MTSRRCLQICHRDDTLVAEVSFWASSAGYELVRRAQRAQLLSEDAANVAVTLLELTGSSDEEIDIIESLSGRTKGKVVAVTELDAKTIGSVRRLFQAKSVEAVIVSRAGAPSASSGPGAARADDHDVPGRLFHSALRLTACGRSRHRSRRVRRTRPSRRAEIPLPRATPNIRPAYSFVLPPSRSAC